MKRSEDMTEDDKIEVVENCLYRLKERDYVTPSQVRLIDDFMAELGGEALADLYDLIRFHDGPFPGDRRA
jgi:hypothetical protein